MFAVGAMSGGGHEVPTDRVVAQRWFRAAAERGHAHAQMMLGRYMARGLAGERDLEQARQWLERAMAQGLQETRADLAALPPRVQEPEKVPSHAVGH
jgi:TPR repeat protein